MLTDLPKEGQKKQRTTTGGQTVRVSRETHELLRRMQLVITAAQQAPVSCDDVIFVAVSRYERESLSASAAMRQPEAAR